MIYTMPHTISHSIYTGLKFTKISLSKMPILCHNRLPTLRLTAEKVLGYFHDKSSSPTPSQARTPPSSLHMLHTTQWRVRSIAPKQDTIMRHEIQQNVQHAGQLQVEIEGFELLLDLGLRHPLFWKHVRPHVATSVDQEWEGATRVGGGSLCGAGACASCPWRSGAGLRGLFRQGGRGAAAACAGLGDLCRLNVWGA